MKKNFCIALTLILVLALSACNGSDVPTGTAEPSFGTPVTSAPSSDNLAEQNAPQTANPASCVFDPAQFEGKLRECAYAGDGKLLAVADKLYLYDTATATVLAVTETPLSDFEVQIMDGGYVLSGMGHAEKPTVREKAVQSTISIFC